MELALPYGDGTLPLTVSERNLFGVVTAPTPDHPPLREAFERAWLEPHGFSAPLDELVRPGKRVTFLVPDHTRKVPVAAVLDLVWQRLSRRISPRDVTVIVATGTHRNPSEAELAAILGPFRELFRVVIHDDEGPLERVGTTSLGTPVDINPLALESDYLISLGHIGMHYFAGYSGGPKMILPGVAGAETIRLNHEKITDPRSYGCVYEDNPIHREMREAAVMAGLWAIVDVVLSGRGDPIGFLVGEPLAAHRAGARLWDGIFQVPIPGRADLVIASPGGYPKDIDLYQAHKAAFNASRAVVDGGYILLVAECRDGIGNRVFADWGSRAHTLAQVEEIMREEGFKIGGHKAYFFALDRERGVKHLLLSSLPDEQALSLGIRPVRSLAEALDLVRGDLGRDFSVLVMPHGADTFPIPPD